MKNDNLPKGKVLIADDDEDSRIMLAFLLQDEGWQIAEASNGKEALEKVVEEKPNVIILDNRMPELTGSEVYQQLRKRGVNIPVVFVTAFSDLEELASSLGIRYYLRKPIDFIEVLAAIESACAENRN
ncbi:MAG TPA: response regulator [Leptolyngbyaceae cyanobacterium]